MEKPKTAAPSAITINRRREETFESLLQRDPLRATA